MNRRRVFMNGSGCIAELVATVGCIQDVGYKTSIRTMLACVRAQPMKTGNLQNSL